MNSDHPDKRGDEVLRKFEGEESAEERKGFSLIEMMVTIAIISILAGISFLSMLHYRMTIRVNASARDLAGHLRIARANALRDGQPFMFQFVNTTDDWGFLYGLDANADGTFDTVKSYTLEPGIQFGFVENTQRIPSHGDPTAMGCAVFTTKGSAGEQCYETIHFERDGSISYYDASINAYKTDGVAYMIPSMDISGTGKRDDRQRGVSWNGTSGRVRLWSYKAGSHVWR